MRNFCKINVIIVSLLILGLIFAHTSEFHSTEGIKDLKDNSKKKDTPKFKSEGKKPSKDSKTKFKSEGKKPSKDSKTKFKSEGKKPSYAGKKDIKQPSCRGQGSCIAESDLSNTGVKVKTSDLKRDEVDIGKIDVGKIDVGKIDLDDTDAGDIDIDDIDDIDIDIDDIDDIDIDIDDIDDIDIDIDYYYDDDDDDDDNKDDEMEDTAAVEDLTGTDVYTGLINESAITLELQNIKEGKFKLQTISAGSVINPVNDSAFALQGLELGNSTVNWINDGYPNQVLALVGINDTKTVIIPDGYNTYLAQNQVVLGKNDFLVLSFVPDLQKWLQVGFEESSS